MYFKCIFKSSRHELYLNGENFEKYKVQTLKALSLTSRAIYSLDVLLPLKVNCLQTG